MHIQKAELIISAPDKKSWPSGSLPEVVLAGRSNVGKSSFINTVLQRKNLAYVGNTPGKTRLLNFFNINDLYILVDVPGYGYAKLSKQQIIAFGEMMEEYFEEREQKKGLVLLVDSRHLPSEDDHEMLACARYYNLRVLVVATKFDKLNSSEQQRNIKKIKDALQLHDHELLAFSSKTKKGLEEARKTIEWMCGIKKSS